MDRGTPFVLVSNSGVGVEDQGDFELLIGFDRSRGDRHGPLLQNGVEVGHLYELCLPTMTDVEALERLLSKIFWGPNGTPCVTERR